MAEKLIRLPQLQRFKTNADLKYQDKLTAGSNITISGNTISAQTTFGQQTIYNTTIPASGWSGTSNVVSVAGISAGDDVEIVGINPTDLTDQQKIAAKNALNLITYGTTTNGTITFYALNGLPSVDIPVTIRKILDTNVTTREYSAGDNVSINNGVISADLSSVYDNSHADPAGDSHYVQCPTGSSTTIFTATRNCKLTISLQVNDAVNSGKNARINLNGAEAYSFYSTAIKWQRIGHAFLLLKTGDVVSVYNDYGVMMDAKIGVYY